MLDEIMGELGAAPHRTLMVGDTTHDLQMAKNAGVAGLGVAFGAHPRAALDAESPLEVVATPGELADWLRQNA
jgi:phosphoglycolate phosphatase